MPDPISDKPFIDKKFFTLKNIGVVGLCVFSCATTWGAIGHRQSEQKAVLEIHEIRMDRQDATVTDLSKKVDFEVEDLDNKIAKGLYNNSQLTYRLNSGQAKIYNELRELIHKEALSNTKERAKTNYIIVMLEKLEKKLEDKK
tara:strand:- start:39 stop:467 length:429 start_codon:yes stop_codon:yes gene_type:complete